VDLVVGAGAHMMQEVEHDGRGWVFHSLGNFLFNARGR
jgi:poly-gamma-glutamate capsule biosynthesis protein CapA/YwtB (metallophosphatase superfamily)